MKLRKNFDPNRREISIVPQLDRTHDPNLRSWVASANGHPEFPIQNLPLGVFTPPEGGTPRAGVAIGEMILDLAATHVAGLFFGEAGRAAEAAADGALNALLALGAGPRRALRAASFGSARGWQR